MPQTDRRQNPQHNTRTQRATKTEKTQRKKQKNRRTSKQTVQKADEQKETKYVCTSIRTKKNKETAAQPRLAYKISAGKLCAKPTKRRRRNWDVGTLFTFNAFAFSLHLLPLDATLGWPELSTRLPRLPPLATRNSPLVHLYCL